MLKDFLEKGYGKKEDLNCAEKILKGANIVYGLDLDEDCCRLISGFGGGLCVGHLCGTVAASVAVLSKLFVADRAHEGNLICEVTEEFLALFQKEMETLMCAPLKARYRTPEAGCSYVIFKAAQALDQVVMNNTDKIVIKCNLN